MTESGVGKRQATLVDYDGWQFIEPKGIEESLIKILILWLAVVSLGR